MVSTEAVWEEVTVDSKGIGGRMMMRGCYHAATREFSWKGPRTCLRPTFKPDDFPPGSLGPEENRPMVSGEFRRTLERESRGQAAWPKFPFLASAAALNASAARFKDKAVVEEPRSAFVERLVRGLFETPAGEVAPVPNLKIRAEVQLPLEADLFQSPFQLKFVAELGEGGEIKELRLVSKPPFGPVPLRPWLKFFSNIPIIGPWVSVRAKKVEMADDRSVRVTANYLLFDVTVERGKMVFEAGGISRRDFEKRGIAAYRVPEYLHQLVGMILAGRENPPNPPLSKGGKKGPSTSNSASSSGFLGAVPKWQQATIEIIGDFSNRTIEVDLEDNLQRRMDPQKARKLRLAFVGKIPQGGHRITIRGGLTSPTVEIAGLKTIEYVHPERIIRATNTARTPTPLTATVTLNPKNRKDFAASFSWNHRDGLKLEEISRQSGQVLSKLELPKGGEVQDFTVRLDGQTPDVSIKRLRTQELRYEGFGVSLHTVADRRLYGGDHRWLNEIPPGTGLEDVHFQVVDGAPHFRAVIMSHMNGVLSYHFPNGAIQGLGRVEFRPISGMVPLSIVPDQKNPDHTRISFINARLHANLPALGLRVSNRSRQGIFSAKVNEADLDVAGTVHVVPQRREVEILADHPGGAVMTTHEASVRFQGKKEEDGTDLRFDITDARFMGHRLKIQPAEEGSLELMEAFFDHMSVSGELVGRGAISLSDPPIRIPFRVRTPRMPLRLSVGSVESKAADAGGGVIVEEFSMDAEEPEPTLLPAEAAACGFDRQRIRLRLQSVEVQSGPKPRMTIRNVGDDLRIHLIEELTGSCLSLGVPEKLSFWRRLIEAD